MPTGDCGSHSALEVRKKDLGFSEASSCNDELRCTACLHEWKLCLEKTEHIVRRLLAHRVQEPRPNELVAELKASASANGNIGLRHVVRLE